MADISIIVPVYKVPEKHLNRCLQSLVSQLYDNIEIILVDDGSPDNCGIICDNYKTDSRVKVIHKINGGLSSARNTGVELASSDWIMFVDGDDWIEPTTCLDLYKAITSYDVDLIMFGMCKDYGKRSVPYHYNMEPYKVFNELECKVLQGDILNYNSNISSVTTKLYKRSLLSENSIIHNENLKQGAEGIEYNFRVFKYIKSAIFLPVISYHYIYNEHSITSTYDEKNHELVLNCFKTIKVEITNSNNASYLNELLKNRMIYVIITTAISGYFNPCNKDSFVNKKKKYNAFLEDDLIKESIDHPCFRDLSFSRRIVFFLIKHRMYITITVLAMIRRVQKSGV